MYIKDCKDSALGLANQGIKKLLTKEFNSRDCAYVYRDGVVFNEHRQLKVSKDKTVDVEIHHICPAEIYISTNGGKKFEGRLVIHNPSLLADGIRNIRIWRDNQSESMKQKGIFCDSVTITTLGGMVIGIDIFPFLCADICIQDGSKQSIMSWDTDKAIWHGERPPKEETQETV